MLSLDSKLYVESRSWSVSSMVSFSLSVSTDELTSVPGTSLHTEELLWNEN